MRPSANPVRRPSAADLAHDSYRQTDGEKTRKHQCPDRRLLDGTVDRIDRQGKGLTERVRADNDQLGEAHNNQDACSDCCS